MEKHCEHCKKPIKVSDTNHKCLCCIEKTCTKEAGMPESSMTDEQAEKVIKDINPDQLEKNEKI